MCLAFSRMERAGRCKRRNAKRTHDSADYDDVCLIPPSAGYTRLENQLYRVEICRSGNFPNEPVTFKWSRDNGIVVTSITKNISGQDVSVHDVGPDDVLGFANGQWVEVSDDSRELNGLPGELIQIQNVNAATKPFAAIRADTHIQKGISSQAAAMGWHRRVDDQRVASARRRDRSAVLGRHLQDGRLLAHSRAHGDRRNRMAEISDAEHESRRAAAARHSTSFCCLALLAFDKKTLSVQQDCRHIFYPLAVNALHVTKRVGRTTIYFQPKPCRRVCRFGSTWCPTNYHCRWRSATQVPR